jgi:transposase
LVGARASHRFGSLSQHRTMESAHARLDRTEPVLDLEGMTSPTCVQAALAGEGPVVVRLRLRRRVVVCPSCSYRTRHRYDRRSVDSRWRHLDLGGRVCVLTTRRRRLRCPEHGVVTGVTFERPGCGRPISVSTGNGQVRALLQSVDFLQTQHVGLQGVDRVGQPNGAILGRSTVENVERRQPHSRKVPT